MTIQINLAVLEFDPEHKLTLNETKYEKAVYANIREALTSEFLTSMDEIIWGYKLPSTIVDCIAQPVLRRKGVEIN